MKIAIVGPLPPPAGGMARQTAQQVSLLTAKGHKASVVQTNLPYFPGFVANLPGVRAVFRLVHFVLLLLFKLRNVDVVHVMANSGWSWYLFAMPPILIAKLYGCRVVINYRGGEAAAFFKTSWAKVKPVLSLADYVVVPSDYLKNVFSEYGFNTVVIANTLDRSIFKPSQFDKSTDETGQSKVILVARNLEAIYDVSTAIKSFKILATKDQSLRLNIAGSGPEKEKLEELVTSLELEKQVTFLGRLEQSEMAEQYKNACILLNTSIADNSPNALIESLSCGTPVVTSNAGGIPYIIEHMKNGLISETHQPDSYAKLLHELLESEELRSSISTESIEFSKRFDKETVIAQWEKLYLHKLKNQTLKGRFDRAYTWIAANLLFPVHERLKSHSTVKVKNEMEARQWWPVHALEVYQIETLKEFLAKISRNVPYYQKLFSEKNFDPSSVKSFRDLEKLPFLTKDVIRNNESDLKASDATTLSKFNTGGSSGEPLIFYIGKERVSHDVAAKWRATKWWDVDIGDKEIVLWGSPIELGKQDKIKQVRDKLIRTELISAFNLNHHTKRHILEKIIDSKPPMLFGYPSVFYMLANFAEQEGIHLSDSEIKVIFVTSERLYDHQKQKIEEVFNAPVANGYGGRDAGFIAHACPEGNMHITADDIIVEIIDAEGKVVPPGEKGEIVVTHMRTGEFPFVRYKTGDIGALSNKPCSCGRSLPILESIEGRTTDFIVAADGTQMHGLALIYHVREVQGVKNFKIEQESLQQTNLYLEVTESFTPDAEQHIVDNFKKRLGNEVQINVLITNKIPAEKSGKYRYVISKVGN